MAGHPTYHVNVIKLKWEIIWTNGLPHLSGLPQLPGVPHLHVNRPLFNIHLVQKASDVNTVANSWVKGVLNDTPLLSTRENKVCLQRRSLRIRQRDNTRETIHGDNTSSQPAFRFWFSRLSRTPCAKLSTFYTENYIIMLFMFEDE